MFPRFPHSLHHNTDGLLTEMIYVALQRQTGPLVLATSSCCHALWVEYSKVKFKLCSILSKCRLRNLLDSIRLAFWQLNKRRTLVLHSKSSYEKKIEAKGLSETSINILKIDKVSYSMRFESSDTCYLCSPTRYTTSVMVEYLFTMWQLDIFRTYRSILRSVYKLCVAGLVCEDCVLFGASIR